MISFKLRVMRLYRLESFYAFLLHFRCEGNEKEGRPAPMQGWPPTARPATAAREHGQPLAAPRHQRGSAVVHPQGATANRAAAGAAAGHKGQPLPM
ncbi:hypothetical protein GW17_00053323 [Ensete ventricosum]|nr:hypothetical protein GW17_00053323 [Ensete ventricosum]RZR85096.1 hypothetical protein BHM03_00012043 [Ensete ventricosum]